MNVFDAIIVQPIFNLLVVIYELVPGHDFGVALILFTILIRLLMWPLVRKQLHQTKVMRKLQPELKRIKTRTKGNKQLEAQLMMELYREKGVSPFSSIGLLIVQLPIFIGLFAVVRLVTENRDNLAKYTYDALEKLPHMQTIIADPSKFDESLFGVVSLTQHAFNNGVIYWPIFILAIAASILQFIQSKQLIPKPQEGRKLRDILKEQATGKDVDQSEITAIMSHRMLYLFPALTFLFSVSVAGALTLYLAVSTAVAVLQQTYILGQDADEMDKLADKPIKGKTTKAQQKAKQAKEAEIVATPSKSKKKKRKGKK